MTISAHPSIGVLSDYASGALPTAPGLVVAAHLQFCANCGSVVRTFEEAGGALLRGGPMEQVGLSALARVLKDISQPGAERPARGSARGRRLPRLIQQIGVGARRSLGPGRWLSPVRAPRRRDWRLFLLRARAKPIVRGRRWRGLAFICVLEGAFRRGGQSYRAGDFGEFPRGGARKLAAVTDGRLLALIATRRLRSDEWLQINL